MKLAVSSIAWTNEEEPAVAESLQTMGVHYVEIAPTKLWDDPTKATDQEIADYVAFWKGYDIEIAAFQSMLFTNPGLKLFESAENREQTLDYLKDFTILAGKMGARALVFGSPKNRQKGDMDVSQANTIAKEFFGQLGDTAKANNTNFCIEPNPEAYACDFVINATQGTEFVRQVGRSGFGLHLDIAGMTLAEDDIYQSIINAQDVLAHFHISEPFLGAVNETTRVKHADAVKALREIGYSGFVSIEMRPGDAGTNVQRVNDAVIFAQSTYAV